MDKQIDNKYSRTFRQIYREKTNRNYTTTNINHKQRPLITKYISQRNNHR